MKKKSERRRITAIVTGIAAVVAFACGAVLTACGGSSKILETPTNLQIADEYLTWDEVEDAKSYVVEINGEEYTTQTNSLDVMEITNEPLTYKFTVLAVGDNKKTYDSDPSEEIKYTVSEPKYMALEKLKDGTYELSLVLKEEAKNNIKGKLIIPKYIGGIKVSSIAMNAFSKCQNITGVYIHDGVQKIGAYAFKSCTSVSKIRMPDGVKTIGIEAFANCCSLKEINLPTGLTGIGFDAFSECSSLQSLVFPNTISSFHQNLTLGCDSLTHIEIDGGETATYKSDGNCIIRKRDNSLILGCNASVIPDYVQTIGLKAFAYCRNLKSITIPEGVKTVTQKAFEHCERLESVYISSTVESWAAEYLGSYAYEANVFAECGNLNSITVAEGNPIYKSDGNCIIRKADNVLVEGCAASNIPDYVTAIGNSAFYGCKSIKKIEIPYGVTEIGEYAFAKCFSVREIYIPNSVKVIKSGAFQECLYASATIPESATSDERNSFAEVDAYAVYEGYNNNSVVAYDEGSAYPYVYSVKSLRSHIYYSGKYGVAVPLRKGYTFLGWATEEGSSEVVYGVEQITFDHTYYNASWVEVALKIENLSVSYIPEYLFENIELYAVWQKND